MQARFLALGALVVLSSVTFADRVITLDNRILECKKAREKDGGYLIQFENGEIFLKDKSLVKAVEIEGDMSDYVPHNDDEKKKLEQGFVKYKGKWLSKPAYGDELAKQNAASKKRAEDIASHAEWANAWTKDTKHFSFQTNTSPELLDYYSDLLETYYDLMDKRFGIKPSPILKRTKMTVKIYKSKKEFNTLSGDSDTSVLGFFNRASQELNFYHNYLEPAQTEWVALHECTHLLTYLIDPQYLPQIWLNEAVADYFGSSQISRDKSGKLSIKPGALQADRALTVQNAIKEGKDTKLDKLFEIEHDDFDGFQYAHAWSFIYFLNEAKPEYKKAFDKFFKDLYTGGKGIKYEPVRVSAEFDKSGSANQASPAEIRRVVLEDLKIKEIADLEREWKDWMTKLPLEGPAARFKRAYVQVIYGQMFEGVKNITDEKFHQNVQAALDDIEAAIQGGMQTARVYWTRGRALNWMRFASKTPVRFDKSDKNKDAAIADLRKAIELDPFAFQYYWDLGNLLYLGLPNFGDEEDESGNDLIVGDKMPKLPDEARKYFGLATELAPENDGLKKRFEKMTAQ